MEIAEISMFEDKRDVVVDTPLKNCIIISKLMTPADISKAQALASELWEEINN